MSSPTPDPDATVDLPDSLASRREQMFPRLTDADIARIRRFGEVRRYERGARIILGNEEPHGSEKESST